MKNIFFLIVLLFFSCVENKDFIYEKNKLTIYYTDLKDSSKVKSIYSYWQKNKLLTNKKQYIRLLHNSDSSYYLQLILSEKNHDVNYKEIKLLYDLQADLNKKIFPNSKFEIKITDNSFKDLGIIN